METVINSFRKYLSIQDTPFEKLLLSVVIVVVLFVLKRVLFSVIRKNAKDTKTVYHSKRFIGYGHAVLLVLLLGGVWIKGFSSIGTYLGIASAGLAIALHETIANIAGWVFIVWKKPFVIGDRIEIGQTKGDVIDMRLFQFTLAEVGNWVEAEQSTGRMVHIPNSQVLKEQTANYHSGFHYIWNEIRVLITYESNWRKTREILEKIAVEKMEKYSDKAKEEIRRAAEQYMIYFNKITPAVYMSAKDSGVLFSIRYIVDPRQRRGSEQIFWEAIFEEFEKNSDIRIAYPTTRFYTTNSVNTDPVRIPNESS